MRIQPKVYPAVLAIAVLGVLLFATGVASAHGGGKQTLRIVATEVQFELVDLGTPGPSLGDELVFSESLEHKGREVGTSGIVCTATGVVAPYDVITYHCVATLDLRRGQVTLQGLIEVQGEGDTGPWTVAITGGTGAYRGAGGEAVVRGTDGGMIYKLRFDAKKNKHHGKKHRGR